MYVSKYIVGILGTLLIEVLVLAIIAGKNYNHRR